MNNIQRGDVFYILDNDDAVGSEQKAGRPAIVVSNDKNNAFSKVAEIVYLTTAPKKKLPTHVVISSLKNNRTSYALCEQVHSVDESRIGDYISTCTNREMEEIGKALEISLDLSLTVVSSAFMEMQSRVEELAQQLAKAETERDMLKSLYQDLQKTVLFSGKETS